MTPREPPATQRTGVSTRACTLPDGRTVAYALAGDPTGTPLVLHHGTPGSRLFAAVCDSTATEAGVRLVAPDRPGYGRSSPPPRGWSMANWGDDVRELLATEEIAAETPVRVPHVGFSGGGPFALAAATPGDRVGLVGTVVPPAETGLARLASIPFAVRLLFRLSKPLARLRGAEAVVNQYTDRSVSPAVADAVAADFREALRQGASAVAREARLFAEVSIDRESDGLTVRAWHGFDDENAPIGPVRELLDEVNGTVIPVESDHLGTFLDRQRDIFDWATG
ncbi:alpha/beta fold hydrolase [Halorubrum laminariae]|uniref:Alpha/beta fold hydrolase n=1 Tax=Halorubrum laminariae TaxID=1433523 RepID=A0ABD6C277_9EURY|nr:alpha/beta hydrolase [Halorubrum laminariae]